METIDYRTKTMRYSLQNARLDKYFPVALDIGYSGVKSMSSNAASVYPSYAHKINPGSLFILSQSDTHDILYRDEVTGDTWRVGEVAQNSISSKDSNESSEILYARDRYRSEMYKVLARVGLAAVMMKDDHNYDSPENKTLMVQSGLPPKYLKGDMPEFKSCLSGEHHFSVKFGSHEFRRFDINLPEENVYVIPQPMGTMMSVSLGNNGMTMKDAIPYFQSEMLIFDPGFGTLDTFSLTKGEIVHEPQTFNGLGMRQVLDLTSSRILDKFGVDIPVPAMQSYLQRGTIPVLDRTTHKVVNNPFADLLEESSRETCNAAINKILEIYDDLVSYNYLVITGGTGEAWYPYIKEFFAGYDNLEIIPGNKNSSLPFIFGNVRGYFLGLINTLKSM